MLNSEDPIFKVILHNVIRSVKSDQKTLEEAVDEQRLLFASDPVNVSRLNDIASFLNKRRSQIELLGKPATLKKKDASSWYLGPQEEDVFWPALESYLRKKWDEDTVNSINDSSSKVISSLAFPGSAEFKTKGLVLGYVQSGKTANFTAVVSKAADVGFRLFIILSGLTNSLRNQTQERLEIDLVSRRPKEWLQWTTKERDIDEHSFDPNALLDTDKKHLAVAKKNAARLRRLLKMLRTTEQTVLAACPTLIIDDECDQASVNASGTPDDPTVINRLVREIISELPKVAYIGYTATPFANLLIDPEWRHLYPEDFIVSLPRPDLYFGAEKLFGRDPLDADKEAPDESGLDIIRSIDEDEIPFLKPRTRKERFDFSIDITDSLCDALLYYLMATAVRNMRGQQNQHSSMLIHTTLYSDVHVNSQPRIERFLSDTRQSIIENDESLLQKMKALWESELERFPPAATGNPTTQFEELLDGVVTVIDSVNVVVENSLSDNRIDYSEPGRRFIVIGGNVLARGLTIEGLIVSFFIRASSSYDSLMQMGRWFGYRAGFEDLPRIWITPILASYFRDMATVESEIRNSIEVYSQEKITPLEFAVPIRTHPDLAVTAAKKMAGAVKCNISFSNTVQQTRKFRHQDAAWLSNNWEAGSQLVDAVIAQGKNAVDQNGVQVFEGVDVASIQKFLEKYVVHEDHESIQTKHLREYIKNQHGSLSTWNIGIIGAKNGKVSDQSLGGCGSVRTVNRAKLKSGTDQFADIKALISRSDIIKDIETTPASNGWEDLKSARRDFFEGTCVQARPLLLLYPIDKDSAPRNATGNRDSLSAVHDVLGMGIVFPKAEKDVPLSYVSAPVEYEQIEYEEETDE